MAEIAELIERMERASEGSFDLDRDILAALGFTWRGMAYWNDRNEMWRHPATVTRSIDAALSLVPEGWSWDLDDGAGDMPCAIVWRAPFSDNECRSHAPTPAIALCAAALRARKHG